jgi:hypothetical protein
VADHILTQGADRIAAENADVLITEFDWGTGGSIVTLYCNDGAASGSNAGTLQTSTPGATTSATGWTVGGATPTAYSRQTYNAEVASTNFTATVQPSGSPVNSAEDCWRYGPSTGTFSGDTWYSSLSVIAVTSGGVQDGRARFRLWRASAADGSNATAIVITNGPAVVGSLVTDLSTTVAQSSTVSFEVPGFELNNEYLFLQVAWEAR